MRFIFTAAAFAAIVASNHCLPAQQPSTPPPTAATTRQVDIHHEIHRLSNAVGLSATQKDQAAKIFEEREAKFKALADDTSMSPEQKKAQRKAILDETDQKINSILGPVQQRGFEVLRERRKRGIDNHEAGPTS